MYSDLRFRLNLFAVMHHAETHAVAACLAGFARAGKTSVPHFLLSSIDICVELGLLRCFQEKNKQFER